MISFEIAPKFFRLKASSKKIGSCTQLFPINLDIIPFEWLHKLALNGNIFDRNSLICPVISKLGKILGKILRYTID